MNIEVKTGKGDENGKNKCRPAEAFPIPQHKNDSSLKGGGCVSGGEGKVCRFFDQSDFDIPEIVGADTVDQRLQPEIADKQSAEQSDCYR